MGRQMPDNCSRCGKVIDWGDFGPDPDDGTVGTTCICAVSDEPPTLTAAMRILGSAAHALGYTVESVAFTRLKDEGETA